MIQNYMIQVSALKHPTEAKDTRLSSDAPVGRRNPTWGERTSPTSSPHVDALIMSCVPLLPKLLNCARDAGRSSEASASEDPKQQGWKHTARMLALGMACGAASLYLT